MDNVDNPEQGEKGFDIPIKKGSEANSDSLIVPNPEDLKESNPGVKPEAQTIEKITALTPKQIVQSTEQYLKKEQAQIPELSELEKEHLAETVAKFLQGEKEIRTGIWVAGREKKTPIDNLDEILTPSTLQGELISILLDQNRAHEAATEAWKNIRRRANECPTKADYFKSFEEEFWEKVLRETFDQLLQKKQPPDDKPMPTIGQLSKGIRPPKVAPELIKYKE